MMNLLILPGKLRPCEVSPKRILLVKRMMPLTLRNS